MQTFLECSYTQVAVVLDTCSPDSVAIITNSYSAIPLQASTYTELLRNNGTSMFKKQWPSQMERGYHIRADLSPTHCS